MRSIYATQFQPNISDMKFFQKYANTFQDPVPRLHFCGLFLQQIGKDFWCVAYIM
jgi:hypothetical protein